MRLLREMWLGVSAGELLRRGLPATKADIYLTAIAAAVPALSMEEHAADPYGAFPAVPGWVVNCRLSASSGSGTYRGLTG